jgi:hypothetical protein
MAPVRNSWTPRVRPVGNGVRAVAAEVLAAPGVLIQQAALQRRQPARAPRRTHTPASFSAAPAPAPQPNGWAGGGNSQSPVEHAIN